MGQRCLSEKMLKAAIMCNDRSKFVFFCPVASDISHCQNLYKSIIQNINHGICLEETNIGFQNKIFIHSNMCYVLFKTM